MQSSEGANKITWTWTYDIYTGSKAQTSKWHETAAFTTDFTYTVRKYRSVWYTRQIMHKDVMQCHEHMGVLHYVMGFWQEYVKQ